MNKAAVNTCEQVFVRRSVFLFIAGSYNKCMFIRNCHLFPKCLYHFTFPPMIYECSTYCNPHEYLKLPIFFILAILVDVLVVSPCGLTLYFPEREIIGFPVLFGHLLSSFMMWPFTLCSFSLIFVWLFHIDFECNWHVRNHAYLMSSYFTLMRVLCIFCIQVHVR